MSDPVGVDVADAEQMRALGARLAVELRAGDLVLLSGDLGAGKTTLAQGIGAGLGVRGPVTSPTFVLARVHPSLVGGPDLVHVDAYRLGSVTEVDDLDLDASLVDAVTVVEWGEGRVEDLAEDRLEVRLARAVGDGPDPVGAGVAAPGVPASGVEDPRVVTVRGVGARWAEVDLSAVVAAARAPRPGSGDLA